MSAKLERLARKLGIDPATLPPVNGNSMTVNLFQPPTVAEVPVLSRQAEEQKLRSEFEQAKRRLNDFLVRENQLRRSERLARR